MSDYIQRFPSIMENTWICLREGLFSSDEGSFSSVSLGNSPSGSKPDPKIYEEALRILNLSDGATSEEIDQHYQFAINTLQGKIPKASEPLKVELQTWIQEIQTAYQTAKIHIQASVLKSTEQSSSGGKM